MMTRKDFVRLTAISAINLGFIRKNDWFSTQDFPNQRPPVDKRKFSSKFIDEHIVKIKASIADKELAWLFENCFPNTLDTTVDYNEINGRPDTFVITGDINAMWLRDSSAQVWPYLVFVDKDIHLKQLILGVINRQSQCINIDPYANAFNKEATGSEFDSDRTVMKPELHERKWEIDSLCYPIRLAYQYWKMTADNSFFDREFKKAAKLIVKTFREQQRKNSNGPYSFRRLTESSNDTVPGGGFGNPVKPVGLICSLFRPSDDATILPFLIPANFFATVALKQIGEMFQKIDGDQFFANECFSLSSEVKTAITQFGIVDHPEFGKIYAYEIDGYGGRILMDDANVPSLLSLPYLGCVPPQDPIYINTRRMVLSSSNPYFYRGSAAEGIGGPHTGKDYIWPISIIMRGLTSVEKTEVLQCLNMLKTTHGGKGFIHESFNKNDPRQYSRDWFAWANGLFGEFILKVYDTHPELLIG